MKKVIIWGNKKEYETYFRIIEPEIWKDNISVIAFVMNDIHSCKYWDGLEIISIEDIIHMEYDYIIDMNQTERKTVDHIIELLAIDKNRIISISCLINPCFDFTKYCDLRENEVSIISSHCWGGFAYHELGLRFASPFINMFVLSNDFFRLLNEFERNMGRDVEFVEMRERSDVPGKYYPVGNLAGCTLHFQHYETWENAIEIWNKRVQRIKYDNLFIEMTCRSEREIECFIDIPFKNKIAFTDIPVTHDKVLAVSNDEIDYIRSRYNGNVGWYMCDKTAGTTPWCRDFDLIGMLLGEEDFKRHK